MKTIVLALLLLAAPAADVTGHWAGTIVIDDKGSGSEITAPVDFQLVQKGSEITGKVARAEDGSGAEIKTGKIDGDHITLEAVSPELLGPAKFDLTIKDGVITGTISVKVEEGKFEGKVKLTKK